MILLENKKAHFDYEILEKLEAGLELLGREVKSLRNKQGSLAGSRAIVRGGEAFLVGMTITPYQTKNMSAPTKVGAPTGASEEKIPNKELSSFC